MARMQKDNVVISFRLPRQMSSDLDEEISLWNEETGASFTRTQILQVLIIRFLVGRQQERNKDIVKDNKE